MEMGVSAPTPDFLEHNEPTKAVVLLSTCDLQDSLWRADGLRSGI